MKFKAEPSCHMYTLTCNTIRSIHMQLNCFTIDQDMHIQKNVKQPHQTPNIKNSDTQKSIHTCTYHKQTLQSIIKKSMHYLANVPRCTLKNLTMNIQCTQHFTMIKLMFCSWRKVGEFRNGITHRSWCNAAYISVLYAMFTY